MRQHSRSIYGCTASDFTPPPDCRYTQNGNRLYLHIFQWPGRHLHLEGLADQVEYAQYLHDGSEPTLESVVKLYDLGGRVKRPSLSPEIVPLSLTKNEARAIVAFMQTLTSEDAPVAMPRLPR